MPCASPPIWLRPSTLRMRRDQHQRQHDAGQAAPAAKDADAAEQHDGDDVELHAERIVGARVGEARGVDDAGDGADDARDDEQVQDASGVMWMPE